MSENEQISISIKLDLQDYVAYNKAYMNFRLPWRGPFYVLLFGGLMVYVLYSSWDERGDLPRFFTLLAFPIFFPIIFFVLQTVLLKTRIKKVFDSDSSLRNEHVYSFSKEGMNIKSPISDLNYFWDDVFEVRETSLYFFVFVALNKAFIIPKKDLYDNKIIEQFKGIFVSNIRDQKKLKFL